jgi:phosphotransferase system HPr (HPr) family protein
MKHSKVVIPWQEGLHLRPAAHLVRMGRKFRSRIVLSFGGRMADLRSILSILALCASMGATLDLEVTGDDEQDAVQAVEQFFASHNGGGSAGSSSV